MFKSKGSIAAWLFGGLAVLSLAMFVFTQWFSTPRLPQIENKPNKSQATDNSRTTTNLPRSSTGKVDDEIDEEDDDDDDDDDDDEDDNASDGEEPDVDVEDAEDDEDDNVNKENDAKTISSPVPLTTGSADEGMKQLRERYESVSKDCSNLINSQRHREAVEALNELISLSTKLQRSNTEIIALYNNRSAMYEKLLEYDNALADIRVMLVMQPDHVRALTRRGRIFEAQGLISDAIDEYLFCNILEMYRQKQPQFEAKVNALAKKIGMDLASKKIAEIYAAVFSESSGAESTNMPPHSSTTDLKDRPLPSKAYMKNVLETFPNTYTWRKLHEKANRASWVAGLQDAKDSRSAIVQSNEQAAEVEDGGAALASASLRVLKCALELVQLDVAQDNMSSAFAVLRSAEDVVRSLYDESGEVSDVECRNHLSQFFELLGTEAQLKSFPVYALRCYRHAAFLCPDNFSLQLKLATLYHELDAQTSVIAIYDRLLGDHSVLPADESLSTTAGAAASDADSVGGASVQSHSTQVLPIGLTLDSTKLVTAWTQLHKAALIVARNPDGSYQANAAARAVEALEQLVIAPLEGDLSAESIGAQLIAHVKIVNVLTHTMAAMEQVPTEEDNAHIRASIQAAKLLDPEHDSVTMLEAEHLTQDGHVDEALELLEKVKRRLRVKKRIADPESTDVVFMVAKASVLSTQAFMARGEGRFEDSMSLFQEVDGLYRLALEQDPTAIEVMAQQAQLRTIVFGDFEGAAKLMERAVPLFRSREELQDIYQMLESFKANDKAVQRFRREFSA